MPCQKTTHFIRLIIWENELIITSLLIHYYSDNYIELNSSIISWKYINNISLYVNTKIKEYVVLQLTVSIGATNPNIGN